MRRGFSVIVGVVASVMLTAGPAAAVDGGVSYTTADNLVQLVNSNPASPAVATASAVSLDTGNTAVTNANLAFSHSVNCTGCRTVTVAVQAVVIEGNPTDIAPQNAAVALNESCTSCLTFAYAHQYVMSPHHSVKIDGDTKERLAGIQRAINWVANSGEDFPTMSGQLDRLSWAFCDTVQQAVGDEHSGSTSVCGAAPFDRRQVDEHG